MERPLGAFEQSFWLYDQVHPVHFVLAAKLDAAVSAAQLRRALQTVQQRHPLLRVRIDLSSSGTPHFVEQPAEIPIRVVDRVDGDQWQQELAVELAETLPWHCAPLARVVLLRGPNQSELLVSCHHAIADGMSSAYLLRDIVAGLSGVLHPFIPLSAAQSLESLVLMPSELAPLASLSAIAPQYSTVITRRPQPQVHTMVLEGRQTRALRDRARAEQTTVHGCIGAAFLLAIASDSTITEPLRCLSPINVRQHLPATVAEAIGLYITYGLSVHDDLHRQNFWEVARSLTHQLKPALQDPFNGVATRHEVIASQPPAELIVQGMQQQYGYDLLVTNLGHLHLQSGANPINITELYGPAVMANMPQERVVGVATVGDRLSLTFCSPRDVYTPLEVNKLMEKATEQLQDAMDLAICV
jgi:NRPS condensation-like uncharacterized protein